jgi:hypothetical protein
MIPEHYVQMTGIVALAALGVAALVVNNEMSQALIVAVAGGIGAFVGYLFPRGGDNEEVQESG